MKTTVVPAQITTVEDRIAGNFTFGQIFLMIVALILATVLYVVIPPRMHLGSFKLVLIILQFVVFGGLAIRINGKIVAEWLAVYSKYSKRPRRYIFTKNDETGREENPDAKRQAVAAEEPKKKPRIAVQALPLTEETRISELMANPSLTLSFELAKKGGIDVSITPIKE
jgi:hypothetical protein